LRSLAGKRRRRGALAAWSTARAPH